MNVIFTARKRSLGQGNIFTPVCHSVHRGGVRGCSGGQCAWLLWGGHAWLLGVCAWFYSGGMHGFIWGGVCGFIWGGMRGFSSFFGYNEIRSMSGAVRILMECILVKVIFTSHYSHTLHNECVKLFRVSEGFKRPTVISV